MSRIPGESLGPNIESRAPVWAACGPAVAGWRQGVNKEPRGEQIASAAAKTTKLDKLVCTLGLGFIILVDALLLVTALTPGVFIGIVLLLVGLAPILVVAGGILLTCSVPLPTNAANVKEPCQDEPGPCRCGCRK